jgi:hypothetical protein
MYFPTIENMAFVVTGFDITKYYAGSCNLIQYLKEPTLSEAIASALKTKDVDKLERVKLKKNGFYTVVESGTPLLPPPIN